MITMVWGLLNLTVPLIPLFFVYRYGRQVALLSERIEHYGNRQPIALSLETPVQLNYHMLRTYLLEECRFDEEGAGRESRCFEKFQISLTLYCLSGFVHLLSLILYGCHIRGNRPGLFIAGGLLLFLDIAVFWVFYGNQLSEYMGFFQESRGVDKVLKFFWRKIRGLMNRKPLFSISCFYVLIMLPYLRLILSAASQVQDRHFGIALTGFFGTMAAYYYGGPRILVLIHRKIVKKPLDLVGKRELYLVLHYITYICLMACYMVKACLGTEDRILFQGMVLLFLFDACKKKHNELINLPKNSL